MTLVMQHNDESIAAFLEEHGVGAERTGYFNTFLGRLGNRGNNNVDFFRAKHAFFAGMGIEPTDENLWPSDAEFFQRSVRNTNDPLDMLLRNQAHSLAHT